MMNSLSKGKNTAHINISSLSKNKEHSSKIKTVNINNIQNSNNIPFLNMQTTNLSITTGSSMNTTNSNSFRYTGILGMKFKTTKSSPEKYTADRTYSGDKGKLLVQNFMKSSTNNQSIQGNSNNTQVNSIISGNVIMEQKETEDTTLDFVKKKLLKKKTEIKQKSNYLNFTNPTNSKQVNIQTKIPSDSSIYNINKLF